MSYSQHGEEAAILRAFTRPDGSLPPGRFLDIGAFDGKTFSNTLALAERGWGGVLVEASPRAFIALQALHGGNPKMSLVNAAVATADATSVVGFHDCPDAVSTTDEANRAKWESKTTFTPIYVGQLGVPALLNQFGGAFDFVSIDTEGTSTDIFLSFPIKDMPTRVWCVEHDGRAVEIANRGAAHGFSVCYLDGNNVVLARP